MTGLIMFMYSLGGVICNITYCYIEPGTQAYSSNLYKCPAPVVCKLPGWSLDII